MTSPKLAIAIASLLFTIGAILEIFWLVFYLNVTTDSMSNKSGYPPFVISEYSSAAVMRMKFAPGLSQLEERAVKFIGYANVNNIQLLVIIGQIVDFVFPPSSALAALYYGYTVFRR